MAASRRRFWSGVICLRHPSKVAADSQRARMRAKLRSAGWGVSGAAAPRPRQVEARASASKASVSIAGVENIWYMVHSSGGSARQNRARGHRKQRGTNSGPSCSHDAPPGGCGEGFGGRRFHRKLLKGGEIKKLNVCVTDKGGLLGVRGDASMMRRRGGTVEQRWG